MEKKRILIVSRSFYPQNWPRAFRTTELAKEFARQGHYVKVIIPKSDVHYEFEKEHNITIADLGKTKWKGLDIKGTGVVLFIRKAVNRLAGWLFEYPNIELVRMVANSLKHEKDYDLLISIAHPHAIHWGVARIWGRDQKIAKTWVAECGDPYMGQENSTSKPPFYFAWVEKWFMRKADFVTVPTEESIKAYYPEFKHKIKVIPQGFRFEDISLHDGVLPEDKTVFGYAGMFIPGKRDPSEFLEYLLSLGPEYSFKFHIYSHSPQLIEPYVRRSNGRIISEEIKPRDQVLYELSSMHFVVNFENSGIKQTPSKLIDYAIIKKPVLSIKFGNLDTKVIMEFLTGNYKNRMILPDIEQYRIERIAVSFLSLANN